MTDLKLSTSRHINAPIQAVFNAWLDPDMLAQFMLPGEGMSVAEASNEATVGGRFSIVMQSPDQQFPHGGEYLEISPYSRIIFTWESPFSTEGSQVTLTFSENPKGGADIHLLHVKFPDSESRDNHLAGWTRILDTLNGVLT